MKIPTEPIELEELLDLLHAGFHGDDASYTIRDANKDTNEEANKEDDARDDMSFQFRLAKRGQDAIQHGIWRVETHRYWDVVPGETWISLRLLGSVSDGHHFYDHQRGIDRVPLDDKARQQARAFLHAVHAVLCERPIKHMVNGEERIYRIIPFDTPRLTMEGSCALGKLGFRSLEFHPHGASWTHEYGEMQMFPFGEDVRIHVAPEADVAEATLLFGRAQEILRTMTKTYAMSAGPTPTRMHCAWCKDSLDLWREKLRDEANRRAWEADLHAWEASRREEEVRA